LTSELALEEPEICSTDPIIPIDNNGMIEELHFGIPGGSGDYADEGDESDERNAIPSASWRRQSAIELDRFALGTSEIDGYEGEHGDDNDADVDMEEDPSQANDGSMQNVEY
jgi:hypothetical protein